jgi:hypothetical protein
MVVAQRTGEVNFPTWSSDSQFIYFLLPTGDPGVFRVRNNGVIRWLSLAASFVRADDQTRRDCDRLLSVRRVSCR